MQVFAIITIILAALNPTQLKVQHKSQLGVRAALNYLRRGIFLQTNYSQKGLNYPSDTRP